MSLRKIAKHLGITPAYLSYMVNGKRPWRQDLYERYCHIVDTSVNTLEQHVNRAATQSPAADSRWGDGGRYDVGCGAGGGIRTHTPLRGADFKSAASAISPPRH